jgi:hypothetical protein
MDQLTGRVSSSSPPTSSDARHAGPHFNLIVFPDGKLILTTPDQLDMGQFEHIKTLMADWLASDQGHPLVIGACTVSLAAVVPTSFEVRHE